jgi:hypothetical protein
MVILCLNEIIFHLNKEIASYTLTQFLILKGIIIYVC